MRRLAVAIVVALMVSSCGTGSTPPSTLVSPSAVSATVVPSSASLPSQAPPSPSVVCPTDSPMTVPEYLGADPACFGGAEVAIAGWEDVPVYADGDPLRLPVEPAWLVDQVPTILASHVPPVTCTTAAGPCPWLDVHLDPGSTLEFETDGAYVVVTGHRDDPAAATCTYAPTDDAPSPPPTADEVQATCRESFVLTSVTAAPAPAGSLDFCPTERVLTIATYQATDPVCFLGRTLRIVGWSSLPPAVDFGGELIEPAWLTAIGIGTLWGVKPSIVDGNGQCPTDGDCQSIFVSANPSSGLSLGSSQRWVLVTGHIDDPAAGTCHFVAGGFLGNGPFPPNVYARQECRRQFVVTGIQNTTAPSP